VLRTGRSHAARQPRYRGLSFDLRDRHRLATVRWGLRDAVQVHRRTRLTDSHPARLEAAIAPSRNVVSWTSKSVFGQPHGRYVSD
jgi:hypothetical protein